MQPQPSMFGEAKLKPVTQRAKRRRRGEVERIAVSATAYGRKCDVFKIVCSGQAQAFQIGGTQQSLFVPSPAVPYGPDSVDDKARAEPESGRNHRLPSSEAAHSPKKFSAGPKQFRPCSGVNGAIHAAAAKQAWVGGIDDGVNWSLCQIALDKFQIS